MNYKYYINRYLNSKLSKKEFKQKRTVLKSFPSIAFIDPSNACNLKCPLCPTGNGTNQYPKGIMKFSLFKKIYDKLAPYLKELHLYNWGEPLLNKDLANFIKYAKESYSPKIVVSSNLSGFSPERVSELIRSPVDLISVSVDGTTQASYEKYRVDGNLESVLENLKLMSEIKQKEKLKTTIRWQFIPMKHNQDEIEKAKSLAKSMELDFRIHRLIVGLDSFDSESIGNSIEKNSDWFPDKKEYFRYKDINKKYTCNFPWDRIILQWDGKVAPCCVITNPSDLFPANWDEPLDSIWNSQHYINAREVITLKKQIKGFVCQNCIDNKGFI